MAGQIKVNVAEMQSVKQKVESNIVEMESFHTKITTEITSLEGNNIFKSTQGSKALLNYYESLRAEAKRYLEDLRAFNEKLAMTINRYMTGEQERTSVVAQASEAISSAAAPLGK